LGGLAVPAPEQHLISGVYSVSEKIGLVAALEVTGAGEVPRAGGAQLSLLPGLGEEHGQEAGGAAAPEGKRGPGRPPGARNKATQEIIDYIGGRYGMPLERVAQLWAMPPHQLAASLGIKLVEAVELQLRAASAALPYLHQKQPQAIDLKSSTTHRFVVVQVEDAAETEQDEDDLTFTVRIAESVEKQEVSEAGAATVHAPGSTDAA
jgi:hypothetical protein